jgi:hypothetical protein
MHFDNEGHIIVSPREVHQLALSDRVKLINNVLIPGIPRAFPSQAQYCDLLHHISEKMGIHPNNLFFKGSTKIGFSIAPKPVKVWMQYGPASDLDLAIVDPGFYQVVDYEVGRWEWNPNNRGRMFHDYRLLREYNKRVRHKGKFDCFGFFDLPKIGAMEQLNNCLESAPVAACCGINRSLKAFVFRDWWGVRKRYDFDLYCLCGGLQQAVDPLPAGGDDPRPYVEAANEESDELD